MRRIWCLGLSLVWISACTKSDDPSGFADVVAVRTSGESGALTLEVTIRSPDTGCSQYANWWEVLSQTETLLYRRILGHSHVDEQPFTRSGGPVPASIDQALIVRAHHHPTGYGGQVLRGSAEEGFEVAEDLPVDFALEADQWEPLPTGCAF